MEKEFNEQEVISRFYMAEDIINNNLCPGSGYDRTLESFQDMLDEAEQKGVKDELCQILNNSTLFKYSYTEVGYDRLYFIGWVVLFFFISAIKNVLDSFPFVQYIFHRGAYC